MVWEEQDEAEFMQLIQNVGTWALVTKGRPKRERNLDSDTSDEETEVDEPSEYEDEIEEKTYVIGSEANLYIRSLEAVLQADDIRTRDATVVMSKLDTVSNDLIPAFMVAPIQVGLEEPDERREALLADFRLSILRLIFMATEPISTDSEVLARYTVMKPFVHAVIDNNFLQELTMFVMTNMATVSRMWGQGDVDDRLANERKITNCLAAAELGFSLLSNIFSITSSPVQLDQSLADYHASLVDILSSRRFTNLLQVVSNECGPGKPFESLRFQALELWSLMMAPYDPVACVEAKYPTPAKPKPKLASGLVGLKFGKGAGIGSLPGSLASLGYAGRKKPSRSSNFSRQMVVTNSAGQRHMAYGFTIGANNKLETRKQPTKPKILPKLSGRVKAPVHTHRVTQGARTIAQLTEQFIAQGTEIVNYSYEALNKATSGQEQDYMALGRLCRFVAGYVAESESRRARVRPDDPAAEAFGTDIQKVAPLLNSALITLFVRRAVEYRTYKQDSRLHTMIDAISAVILLAAESLKSPVEEDKDIGMVLISELSYTHDVVQGVREELWHWTPARGVDLLQSVVACTAVYFDTIAPLVEEQKLTIRSKKKQNIVAMTTAEQRQRAEDLAFELAQAARQEAKEARERELEDRRRELAEQIKDQAPKEAKEEGEGAKEEEETKGSSAPEANINAKPDPEAKPDTTDLPTAAKHLIEVNDDLLNPKADPLAELEADEELDMNDIEMLRDEFEDDIMERDMYDKVAELQDVIRSILHPAVIANVVFCLTGYETQDKVFNGRVVRLIELIAKERSAMLFQLTILHALGRIASRPKAELLKHGLNRLPDVVKTLGAKLAECLKADPGLFLTVLTPINVVTAEVILGLREAAAGARGDGAEDVIAPTGVDFLAEFNDDDLIDREALVNANPEVEAKMKGIDGQPVVFTDDFDSKLRARFDELLVVGDDHQAARLMMLDFEDYTEWQIQRRIFQLGLSKPTPAQAQEYGVIASTRRPAVSRTLAMTSRVGREALNPAQLTSLRSAWSGLAVRIPYTGNDAVDDTPMRGFPIELFFEWVKAACPFTDSANDIHAAMVRNGIINASHPYKKAGVIGDAPRDPVLVQQQKERVKQRYEELKTDPLDTDLDVVFSLFEEFSMLRPSDIRGAVHKKSFPKSKASLADAEKNKAAKKSKDRELKWQLKSVVPNRHPIAERMIADLIHTLPSVEAFFDDLDADREEAEPIDPAESMRFDDDLLDDFGNAPPEFDEIEEDLDERLEDFVSPARPRPAPALESKRRTLIDDSDDDSD
ncbi:hypothetical protein J8273_2970 [Carpediemonas membranifera]|uniref:Uncharacterized protein n=1 Tax=Carpediemonas membranifera TaxID=201153 RepID=A0A8J6B4A2_9EUKA|nr:hypothetical protein J8273_2970 [Carpediemonas membranifera]|eukprot:KAG9395403.1 hypothetical protein J8273_2970 [Carpediemonas membranifera]